MPGYKTYQEAAEALLNRQIEEATTKDNRTPEEIEQEEKEQDKRYTKYLIKKLEERCNKVSQ